MLANRVIERKRDGVELAPDELRTFCQGFLAGDVAPEQMSAFLMAIVFRGLTDEELFALLEVMIGSGSVLDLSGLTAPKIDKHSTGGVGDKVSLVLAPLVAEFGIAVPMMSGRGLGHTGGTLDKLESIPGFRVDPDATTFTEVLADVGCAMTGQTDDIAPLDRALYALRSVTGTVPSIPLIAASIMSKKLAEDLDGLVLDVKVGRGAFLTDPAESRRLARTMVDLGTRYGVETRAVLTDMDHPLGRTAGNALEVREAIECLQGAGPPDLARVTTELAGHMLVLGGRAADVEEGIQRATRTLESGGALDRFRRLVALQGGNPAVVDDLSQLPSAPTVREVRATAAGIVQGIDPLSLGWGVVALGGGRATPGAAIDAAVGFEWSVTLGQAVETGDLLGQVHARSEADAEFAVRTLREAVEISEDAPAPRRALVREVIGAAE